MSYPLFFQFPTASPAVDYRSIAEAHQRKANIALARAQEQEELVRRQQRKAELEAELASLYQQEDAETQYRRRLSAASPFASYAANEEPQYEFPAFGYSRPVRRTPQWQQQRRSMYDRRSYQRQLEAMRLEQERRERIEALRLEQERREQLSRKRRAEESLEREQRTQEDAFARFVSSLLPALAETKPAEKAVTPAPKPVAQPAPRKLTKDEELARQIWNSFAGVRTDEEKAMILKELHLPVPSAAPVTAPEAVTPTPQPATAKPKVLPTANPRRSSVPASIHVRFATPETRVAPETPKVPESPSTKQHTLLTKILNDFKSLKSSFVPPSELLEFTPESTGDAPALTYNKVNAFFHQYESDLIKLLYNLDAVESDGKAEVREERKRIVRTVEAELDRLDKIKKDAWTAQHPVAQPYEINIPIEEVSTPAPVQEESNAMAVDEPVQEVASTEVAEELEVAASVALPEDQEAATPPEAAVDTPAEVAVNDAPAEVVVDSLPPVESVPEDTVIAEDAQVDMPATPASHHAELPASPSTVSEDVEVPIEEPAVVSQEEVPVTVVEESVPVAEAAPIQVDSTPAPEEEVPAAEESTPEPAPVSEPESVSEDPVVIDKRESSILTISSDSETSDVESDSDHTTELVTAPVESATSVADDHTSDVISLPSSTPKSSPKYHVTIEDDADADFEML